MGSVVRCIAGVGHGGGRFVEILKIVMSLCPDLGIPHWYLVESMSMNGGQLLDGINLLIRAETPAVWAGADVPS